jgi:hypothetical protein
MDNETTVEDYAKLILRKCNWSDQDEYKKLEIMNTMMMCVHDLLDGKNRCRP